MGHLKLKRLFGIWEECNPPKWVWRIYNRETRMTRLYDREIYLRGRTFEYKISAGNDWGQGWSNDKFYRRLRW